MILKPDKIRELDFAITDRKQLAKDLEKVLKLVDGDLIEKEKMLLQKDLKFYVEHGSFLVKNTFAGGIIFLREPETIIGIKIEFNPGTDQAIASVEYASEKRNARNIKYKPHAGKIESTVWNMNGIFPNFNKHPKALKKVMIAIVGNIIKGICEHLKKHSWFMEFEKEFEIALFLNHELVIKYNVEIK